MEDLQQKMTSAAAAQIPTKSLADVHSSLDIWLQHITRYTGDVAEPEVCPRAAAKVTRKKKTPRPKARRKG